MNTLTVIVATLALSLTFSVGSTTVGGGSGMDDTSIQAIGVAPDDAIPPPDPQPVEKSSDGGRCLACRGR